VPKHDAFNRSFNRLTPATLKAINELVVEAAVNAAQHSVARLRQITGRACASVLFLTIQIVSTVIPGRRSEAQVSPESILRNLWLSIPGSRPSAEPRNDRYEY
jgi:hypothetical protein